ncbi:MAG TPA: DUF2811 domain-containing protein [Trichocoleus sp.]
MTTIQAPIALEIEVPAELHDALQKFLDDRKGWSQNSTFSAALSQFLMQQGVCDRRVNGIYLETAMGGGK